ncbi:unnamed protein product [Litomosoides sigmodontis]|uniref:Uncharacterized protein n=1 Tax=Litomosoides sigmodontis TaxID=42156 RepID=A0A3P6V3N2_LITSI|nr:unnamed protein product [Litomosoides sigmodontis]
MSPDNISSTKNSSIFLSLFSRKKRPNRSVMESSDDSKKITPSSTQLLTNGKTDSNRNANHSNGYSKLANPEMLMVPLEAASTSWAKEFQPSQPAQQEERKYEIPKTDFTLTDHKRHCKNFGTHSSPSQPDILPNVRSRSESRSFIEKGLVLPVPKKAYSIATVNRADRGYLMEALETLADAQPLVARSIPKHAVVDTSSFAARSLDNCLFDATVYDAMLHDSLKVCEMLQNHLSQCIVTARTNRSGGYLAAVTEECEEDRETVCNENRLSSSSRHSSMMTSGTITLSDSG